MSGAETIFFPPFQLDLTNECLNRGAERIALKPKVFAVLRHLIEHPAQLVTKEALFAAVWGKTRVGDAVLRGYIRELRKALQDSAHAPHFIETVHGRGFRFIATISSQPSAVSPQQNGRGAVRSSLLPFTPPLVGRESELAQLQDCLEKAQHGERQMVFVSGEAGIGKTTLVNAFQTNVATQGKLWIGQGQCIEHYGAGEAYLPVLEALGRLCRGAMGEECIALLKQHAPTWLVQMPAVLSPAELSALQHSTRGSSRQRMLREFAEASEVLSLESPLVLIFEDVHWSDYSTLDLLSFVARRPEAAHLLIVATYRPEDIPSPGHPLLAVKNELQIHHLCAELPLPFLSEAAVAAYLETQFSGVPPAPELVRVLHRMSEGNPLFLVNVFRDLLEQKVLEQVDGVWTLASGQSGQDAPSPRVPHSLQQLISWQIGRLSPDAQQVLEAASIAGAIFTSAAVAAGIGLDIVRCEEVCESLVHNGRFLHRVGTSDWPDGTRHSRYEFVHALYQEVLYRRLSSGKQVHLHRQIGERTEKGYGAQARMIAGELAGHFERARDFPRAIEYRQQATENAVLRYAYREAQEHCRSGLELLKQIADPTPRAQLELTLRCRQLGPLVALKGEACVEVEQVCGRALALCQQLGDFSPRRLVQFILWSGRLSGGKVVEAHDLAGQILADARRTQEADALVWAHFVSGLTESCAGSFSSARAHLEQLRVLHDPQLTYSALMDPKTGGLSHLATILWFQGYPEQARQTGQEVLRWAQQCAQPYGIVFAGLAMARLRHLEGDFRQAQEQTQAVIALATEHGLAQIGALGEIFQGWTQAALGHEQEGLRQMQVGLSAYQKTGARLFRTLILALLAEVYAKVGQVDDGLGCIADALAEVHTRGERQYEAELYRLKGELLLAQQSQKVDKDAEECFRQSIAITQQQQAKSLELRAVMSLSRLLQKQAKRKEAKHLLSNVYGWFTEGFETADLQTAKVLLVELS